MHMGVNIYKHTYVDTHTPIARQINPAVSLDRKVFDYESEF